MSATDDGCSYLVLLGAVGVGYGLANEVKIFLIQLGILLTLLPPLPLSSPPALFRIFILFLFVFVYDEAFANLRRMMLVEADP